MTGRYVAFDVETPNCRNDRMSAIGVTVLENGVITEEFSTLVNPETWFDAFNISLTGITPEMAERAPDFAEVWRRLSPLLDNAVLAAHNAPFDMGVLAKCMRAYCISEPDTVRYICTCRAGRRMYPELPDHKLNTMCAYLGVGLNHHEAGSDSRACALLLNNYLDRGMEPERFIRTYDLAQMRTLETGNRKGGRTYYDRGRCGTHLG